MSQVTTAADWAPYIGVSLLRRLFSFARSAWVMFVVDNPLSWRWGFRGKYLHDDIEGEVRGLLLERVIPGIPPASVFSRGRVRTLGS